jgi:hypothetical protein
VRERSTHAECVEFQQCHVAIREVVPLGAPADWILFGEQRVEQDAVFAVGRALSDKLAELDGYIHDGTAARATCQAAHDVEGDPFAARTSCAAGGDATVELCNLLIEAGDIGGEQYAAHTAALSASRA